MERNSLKQNWKCNTADQNTNLLKICDKNQGDIIEAERREECFAVDTTSFYVPTLKLIFRDDSALYFSYRSVPVIEYDPDKGIYLNIARKTILITGNNLEPLSDWIGRYRVLWIRESKTGYALSGDKPFIQNILITKRL